MTTSPGDVTIELRDVTVTFDGRPALLEVTETIRAGTCTAVIGPNGSGKTTLLRTISGLLTPTSGSVTVGGRPATQADVAHVLQSTVVNEQVPLTVEEVVRMGRYRGRGALRRLTREDHRFVAEAMEQLDITDLAGRHLEELSGGQRQRVYVAQGIAQQADVLLLDEPITGLDMLSEEAIQRLIEQQVADGRTVVFTTHDVATAAASDAVILLATHVVASGDPDAVLADEHLSHAYGGQVFTTPEGTLVLGDPHHHNTLLSGHDHR